MIAALALATTIAVSDVWSRPAIATGVVYMRITNRGDAPERLDAARSPAGRGVEIHRSVDESHSMPGMVMPGVMSMDRVRSVTIPAHGSVTFAPGGLHLMLIGLHRELHTNMQFPVTLHFVGAGWMTVKARVRPL